MDRLVRLSETLRLKARGTYRFLLLQFNRAQEFRLILATDGIVCTVRSPYWFWFHRVACDLEGLKKRFEVGRLHCWPVELGIIPYEHILHYDPL